MKPAAQLGLIALLMVLVASNAAASGIDPWPPSDPDEPLTPRPITTPLAMQLRDLQSFGDLQKTLGARGKLISVDATAETPRAIYQWTGAAGGGRVRVFLYRSGDFGIVLEPAEGSSDIRINNFGGFACATCSPPVKACGRRPVWVPHSVHWDTFDCDYTLTGPATPTSAN